MEKYLAIDIGGSFIKFGEVQKAGTLSETTKVPTPQTLPQLEKIILAKIAQHPEIKGVGISCPGAVDPETGTIYNGGALPYLDQVSFKKIITEKFSLPCVVSNDAKAAAAAELWLGNLQGIENGGAIVLGTGVGGGLIVGGKILQGSHFQAGELSFVPRQAQSGAATDLIGYTASAVLFIQACGKLLALPDINDGKKVFAAIAAGNNPELLELFAHYCREIGYLIMNLQATLDIEKIVIGGGISAQAILIQEIQKQYQFLLNQSDFVKNSMAEIPIEACKFGNEANLLGAVYQLLITA